jgi:hypothetical protein
MVEILDPKNDLEKGLKSAQEGSGSFDSFVSLFMTSELFVASTSDLSGKEAVLEPLLFDRDGVPMAAVFTEQSRASLYKGKVKGLAGKLGKNLLLDTPQGYGLVINPGFDVGLEVLPDGIESLLKKVS